MQQKSITSVLQAYKKQTIQRMESEEEEPLQRKAVNRTGLPDNLKSGIEQLSGLSMDHVRVHYNSDKPAQLQALAYTQGSDIHVAPGQERHLPHEAWHAVQQMQGRVQPTTQLKGLHINDSSSLEREADVMGERAINRGEGTPTLQRQTEAKTGNTIQRYRFIKSSNNSKFYQVSQNGYLITGLESPNHELYIPNTWNIPNSYFLLFSYSDSSLFPNHKRVSVQYQNKYIEEMRQNHPEGNSKEEQKRLSGLQAGEDINEKMKEHVNSRMSKIEKDKAVKKMKKDNNWINLVFRVEKVLKSQSVLERFVTQIIINNSKKNPTNVAISRISNLLLNYLRAVRCFLSDEVVDWPETSNLKNDIIYLLTPGTIKREESIFYCIEEMLNVLHNQIDAFITSKHDKDIPVMSIHQYVFNNQMLNYLKSDMHPLLMYRSCHMAAHLMPGISHTYSNSKGNHIARQLIWDGSDWVALETFATMGKEGDMIGKPRNDYGNYVELDNSWQYVMYGDKDVNSTGSDFSMVSKYRIGLKTGDFNFTGERSFLQTHFSEGSVAHNKNQISIFMSKDPTKFT